MTVNSKNHIKIQWSHWAYTRQQIDEDEGGQCHRALERAYLSNAPGPVCTCTSPGVPMSIASAYGRYIIRRMPNSGHLHRAHCESFSGVPAFAKDIYSQLALSQTKQDAPAKIKLSVPLHTIVAAPPYDPESEHVGAQPGAHGKHPMMTLRGYMHFLWETAGLNVYHPESDHRRSYTKICQRIEDTAEEQLVFGGRQRMSDRVFIPRAAPFEAYQDNDKARQLLQAHQAQQIALFEDKLEKAKLLCKSNEEPIILMLGEIYQIHRRVGKDSSVQGIAAPAFVQLRSSGTHHEIRDYQGILELLAKKSPGMVADMLTPGPNIWKDQDAHLWLLLGVQLKTHTGTGKKYLRLVYAGAMPCTDKHIPVESSFEMRVARLLQHEKRRFEKPLRYERDKASRPDFILLDTKGHIPMEVFGFSGQAYEARKLQKIEHARRNHIPLWTWEPQTQKEIPQFPPIDASQND